VGRVLSAALAALLLGAVQIRTPRPVAAELPEPLETYLTRVLQATPRERQQLIRGTPITKLLETNEAQEVAVFGATWIAASMDAYVEQVKDIENFERGGGFKDTTRISDPPRLEDFASMTLPSDEISDLRRCRVGDCIVKLGAPQLRRLQTEIDWRQPTAKTDAMALFRRMALEYVVGYREGGNARLAVYRDSDRPTFVANELRSMVERLPMFETALPDLQRYLLDYPAVSLDGATDFLYWQETRFGLRPTIRINHLVIQHSADRTVVASKMLYASHYFWTALELRVLLPDPPRGPGFWFAMVSRARSGGLTGFVGRIIRGRVRSEAKKGTLAVLVATKARLEKAPEKMSPQVRP